ncbi:RNA polymerase alpha subunit C-terminal domain-containing protein [Taibaiella koreensis]|uniref:RNA polymerase alpha subunit C-terminal domain-containing protein n=1 Tax=Taibaiella koreensis TaxID=1268548 RepID=UPI001F09CBC8|nr:RNA polymerase alpha subunit C-terminal domain-containing protein [Taibaiella koreensis]
MMNQQKGTKRTCPQGHVYYKSSDCPTCPVCERESRPEEGFLALLGAPARRALEHADITSLKKLATYTQKAILKLHGMGPASIPALKKALQDAGLDFKPAD